MKRAAAEWLSTALVFNPRNRGAHLALAKSYDEIGDLQTAKKHRKLDAAPR